MDLRKVLVGSLFAALVAGAIAPASAGGSEPPRTEFEEGEGADWTSHAGELSFLEAVDEASDRVLVETIGLTKEGRPLQLVRVGYPVPAPATLARQRPTTLFV